MEEVKESTETEIVNEILKAEPVTEDPQHPLRSLKESILYLKHPNRRKTLKRPE
jgi:hypothetical protein